MRHTFTCHYLFRDLCRSKRRHQNAMTPMAGRVVHSFNMRMTNEWTMVECCRTETRKHLLDFQFIDRRYDLPGTMQQLHDRAGDNTFIETDFFCRRAEQQTAVVFWYKIDFACTDRLFQFYEGLRAKPEYLAFHRPDRNTWHQSTYLR